MATTTKKRTTTKKKTTTATKKSTRSAAAVRTSVSTNSKRKPIEAETVVTKAVKKDETSKSASVGKLTGVARTIATLRKWNLAMALLHALQGVAIIALSQERLFPLTTNYLTVDKLASSDSPILVSATKVLADVNVAYIIAAFFFMSAIAHVSIATWYRNKYEAGLRRGINKARWIEYSLSASTMLVAIALIAGIADVSTLLMMFGLTSVMNLTGLLMEWYNIGRDKVDWKAYVLGCFAGLLPWVVYAFYVYGSEKYGQAGPPEFVYAILLSIFLTFNIFALNMYLQYKKIGRWSDYLYGEKAYILLSLIAKSALAWQVFAGTLRP